MTEKSPNTIKNNININIQEVQKTNKLKETHTQIYHSQNVKKQRQEIVFERAIENRPIEYKRSSKIKG